MKPVEQTAEPRGLVIVGERGRSYPKLHCERCGEEITDINMAGVAWQPSPVEGDSSRPVVLCKPNRCLGAPEYRFGWYWCELRHVLYWLLSNLGVKTEEELVAGRREEMESPIHENSGSKTGPPGRRSLVASLIAEKGNR